MLHRARIPALLLAAALAVAADAPTDAEWAPVAQALEAGGAEAVNSVEAITKSFPKWPDGFRALASAKLRINDTRGAWSAARGALALNKNDADAAALGIQALAGLGRYDDAFKVADLFTDATDPSGTVASQAAICALQAGNDARVDAYLKTAKTRSGPSGIAMLEFVAAKRAQRAKDLPGAVAALERAVAGNANYRDAFYELGRVRMVQALQTPAEAADLLEKAEVAFFSASRLYIRDADSRFGLGHARLERAKLLQTAGKSDEAGTMLRQALTALDDGLQLRPDSRDAKLWKGDALLRLERFDEAVPFLRQALAGGAIDRALPFNLSLALSRSGKPEEAAKVLDGIEAQNTDERLTLAMNTFGQGNWAAASKLFHDSIDGPEGLPAGAQRWSTYRYLGHCAREQAAQAEASSTSREEFLEMAGNYYKEAGDNGDFASRHWYMTVQVPRSPLHAFVAGRQSIKWDGAWNPPAWKLLVANYGYKVTRGEGVPGAFKNGLPHVMLWLLLAIIPVGLFLKGWLMPQGLYGTAGGKTGGKPAPRPANRPAAKPAAAGARKPGAATAQRRPPGAKPPSRALSPKTPGPGGPKTPFSE